MVISEANLDFCSTIAGWALPEITLLSRPYFPYMRNTFSSVPLFACSSTQPHALPSLPLYDTFAWDAAQTTKPVPKPHIYITIGVPMPRNTHDAHSKSVRESEIFTYNTNLLYRGI